MPIKISGAAFKDFYSDPAFWPQKLSAQVAVGEVFHAWHEDETVLINGVQVEDVDLESVLPDDVLTISGGVVWHDVRGTKADVAHSSLEAYIERWQKQQSTDVLVVEVPKDKRDEIVAALEALGAKVL